MALFYEELEKKQGLARLVRSARRFFAILQRAREEAGVRDASRSGTSQGTLRSAIL